MKLFYCQTFILLGLGLVFLSSCGDDGEAEGWVQTESSVEEGVGGVEIPYEEEEFAAAKKAATFR